MTLRALAAQLDVLLGRQAGLAADTGLDHLDLVAGLEPQIFQSLGNHSTNELTCHLNVVEIWILMGQSQSVIVKEKIGQPVSD